MLFISLFIMDIVLIRQDFDESTDRNVWLGGRSRNGALELN